jgi:hypothetical protein
VFSGKITLPTLPQKEEEKRKKAGEKARKNKESPCFFNEL